MSRLREAALVLGLCTALTAWAHNIDNRRYADGTPVLIPSVKKFVAEKGVLRLPSELTVSAPAAAANEVEVFSDVVKEYFPSVKVRKASSGSAFCRLELGVDRVPDSPEGYTLLIDGSGIVIRARDVRGLFYGVRTVGNMIRNAEKPELPYCRIADWPDFARRGIYFEWRWARDGKQLPKLLREFEALGALKYNVLMLELAELFPYKNNPFTKRNRSFSTSDVEALKAAAKRNHIEIVPYLQVLSHDLWTHAHPKYWQEIAEGAPFESAWACGSCPLKPLSREIYRMAIREQIECYKPRYFIICLDEVAQCPWGVCELCRKHSKNELLRMAALEYTQEVLKYGVIPIIFHDQFYPGLEMKGEQILPELDKRVNICVWNYSETVPPEKLEYFKKQGFPVVAMTSTNRINNLKSMPTVMKKLGLDGIHLAFWGTLRVTWEPRRVSPAGLGGYTAAANYEWNVDDIAPSGLRYDPARETLRLVAPELVTDTIGYRFAPLPLDRGFNAKLGREAAFPQLDAAQTAKLKTELAATREKYHLATAPDGGYFALRAGTREGEENETRAVFGKVRADVLSFLLAAGFPVDTPTKFDRSLLGFLTVGYADGSQQRIILGNTLNITQWNATYSGFHLRFVNRFNDRRGALAGLFAFDWKNPYPEREIVSITLHGEGAFGIPLALFAVSAGVKSGEPAVVGRFDDAAVSARITGWSRGAYEHRATLTKAERKVAVLSYESGAVVPKETKIGLSGRTVGRMQRSVVDDPSAPTPGKVLKLELPKSADGVTLRPRLIIDIPVDFRTLKDEVRTLAFDYKFSAGDTVANPAAYFIETSSGRLLSKIPFHVGRPEDGRWYRVEIPVDRMRKESGGIKPAEADNVRLSVFFHPLKAPSTVWFGPVTVSPVRADVPPPLRLEKVPADASETVPPAKEVQI